MRLISCLGDNREAVRNEVLLVLAKLTATRSKAINPLIAFNEGFDRVFDMLEDDGESVFTPDLHFQATQQRPSTRAPIASILNPTSLLPAPTRSSNTPQTRHPHLRFRRHLSTHTLCEPRPGGLREGSIITHDCLRLLSNLVDGNPSTQRYFCEMGHLRRLAPSLNLENLVEHDEDDSMSGIPILEPRQREGLHLALCLIKTLVSGP